MQRRCRNESLKLGLDATLSARALIGRFRAAANDIDFKSRATRGSVCNGLFVAFLQSGVVRFININQMVIP